MADHQACHGCLDGCTRESAVHCTICVGQAWPRDATVVKDLLMDAAAEVHRYRKHPPYGSSFLDCDRTPCTRYRAGIGTHGYLTDTAPTAREAGSERE